MVAMQFSCPHCGGLFQVDSSLGGQQVSCPHCRGVVVLPAMAGHPQPGCRPGGAEPVLAGPAPGQSRSGRSVHPVRPSFAPQPQLPPSQERPLGPAPGFPPQPTVPTGQERPRQGPQFQRPLRPVPLGSQPAGPAPGQEQPLGVSPRVPVPQTRVVDKAPDQARGVGGPQRPLTAPRVPSGPATPGARPGRGPARWSRGSPAHDIPAAPGRPEVPLSSAAHLGGGMPAPASHRRARRGCRWPGRRPPPRRRAASSRCSPPSGPAPAASPIVLPTPEADRQAARSGEDGRLRR